MTRRKWARRRQRYYFGDLINFRGGREDELSFLGGERVVSGEERC